MDIVLLIFIIVMIIFEVVSKHKYLSVLREYSDVLDTYSDLIDETERYMNSISFLLDHTKLTREEHEELMKIYRGEYDGYYKEEV